MKGKGMSLKTRVASWWYWNRPDVFNKRRRCRMFLYRKYEAVDLEMAERVSQYIEEAEFGDDPFMDFFNTRLPWGIDYEKLDADFRGWLKEEREYEAKEQPLPPATD